MTGNLDEHGRTQQLYTHTANDKIKTLVGKQQDEWGGIAVEPNQDGQELS